jgi:hypothetical protein
MAIEKVINTRIQLKYDTLANWEASSIILKAGEVAIIAVTSAPTQTVNSVTAPQCLMKIGDGKSTFTQLPYASALAADVYSWAKKSEADFTTWVNTIVTHPTIPTGFTIAVNVTDDDVIVADLTGGTNSVSGSISHAKKGPTDGFTGGAVADAVETYGEEITIKVPKLTVDAYGHVSSASDVDYTVKLPAAPVVNDGTLTLKAGGGLSATEKTFTANDADNIAFEVSHGAKPTAGTAHAATADSGRTYVTKVDVDAYGHIAKVYTATESDQDLSNYKIKQTAVDDPTASGNATAFIDSITQNANGEITVTKKNITAADLGLSGAMHFVGIKDALPETAKDGDVVIVNGKEYVWDGDSWSELGDESSHALKSVSITGTDGLTGGGTLEADREIKHAVPAGAAAGKTTPNVAQIPGYGQTFNIPVVETDKFGHIIGKTTTTVKIPEAIDISNKKDKQTAYSVEGDTAKTVTKVEQDENGVVTVTYSDIAFPAPPTVNDGKFTVSGTGALTGTGFMTANQAGNTTADLDIANGGVSTIKLADSAVTTAKISSKAITTEKVADNAIGAAQLKSVQGYAGADAEVWVFCCGSATELVD